MKWLTMDIIKAHSRIDFDCDDELLAVYANAAERTVLNVTRRTLSELEAMKDDDGDFPVPTPIVQASLMLVDHGYQQRSPVTQQNLYTVPYTFDMLVKPYMKLTE